MENSVEQLEQFFKVIRDERLERANTATRIGSAFLMLLHYILDPDSPFIRKDRPDSTAFLLTLLAGASVGDSGQIRLNPDGSISCSRLEVEGSAIFNELVFNHQNVLEGDTYFSDRGTIEDVSFLGGNQYRLLMRKEHDNDVLTFHAYDILRCAMNNLDTEGTYKTSWMRVNSVDTSANTVDVTLYNGEDVPGGVNYEPAAGANVIRWGNQVDTTRQQVFFVSSEDGRIVYYINQTQPIVGDENYGFVIGRLPDIKPIYDAGLVGEVGIYTKNILFERSIVVSWMGDVKYLTVDLGEWDPVKAEHGAYYFRKEVVGTTTECTRVQVSYHGQIWQTQASQSMTITSEPTLNDSHWVHVSGKLNDIIYYTTSVTDDLEEGGVGEGAGEEVRWETDQRFFLQKTYYDEEEGEIVENLYYFSPLRPYMWRKVVRSTEDAGDTLVIEEPTIIGIYGQTGVNYFITSTYDHIALDQNETTKTITDTYSFYSDNGGIRNPFSCYAIVRKRTKSGSYSYIFHKFYGTGTVATEITVTEDDAAIEIFCNSSGQDMTTTYLIKKEIPVIKAAKGDKGDPGDTGLAGPITRIFQNTLPNGQIFCSGTGTGNNAKYKDYVVVGYPQGTVPSGYKVYECIYCFEYMGNSDKDLSVMTPRNLTAYLTESGEGSLKQELYLPSVPFQEVNLNAVSAFFTNLIAQNAHIRMLTGSNFIITDDLGAVLAGMGNMTDSKGNKYYLWSGGENADKATFKVYADGTVEAMRGNFSGFVTHKTTILHEHNIKDFTIREVSAFSGAYENTLQYKWLGQSFAFYQTPLGNPYFHSEGSTTNYDDDIRVFPVGYGYIEDGLPVASYADIFENGVAKVSGDLYLNLPFFIQESADLYGRSNYLSWFAVNNINGLGLYRRYKNDITATESQMNADTSIGWVTYLYKFVGDMCNDARSLIGTKITLLFYGKTTDYLLNIRGCFTERIVNGQTVYKWPYEIFEWGVDADVSIANYITLECKEMEYTIDSGSTHMKMIAWEISDSYRGYYDRYTLGLDDIND